MVRKLFSFSEILSVVVIVLAISIFGAHLFGALEVDGASCDTEGVWSVGVMSAGEAWTGGINTYWYTSKPTASSYVLTSPDELAGLASLVTAGNNFSGKTITLANDIDLGSKDWATIGNSPSTFFGIFDGGGHNISNLYIYLPSTYHVGLFSNNSGTVKNVNVSGSVSGLEPVGGVVGDNSGTVSDCSNTGSVSGNKFVGGVVGLNSSSGTMNNCSNTGSISGNQYIGGVVGWNMRTMGNCSNTGSVLGNTHIGGVVGNNYSGTVRDCSNTGSVSGTSQVGGVIGWVYSGTVRDCSNTGSVSGTSQVGGVIGWVYDGTVTNCEWVKNDGNVLWGIGSNNTIASIDIAALKIVGVIVRPTQVKIDRTATQQLTSHIHPASADISKKYINWSSGTATVATVDANGLVTGHIKGSATIMATTSDDVLGGGKASASVFVEVDPVSVTGIALNKSSADIKVNETEKLTATIFPADATNRNVNWSSNNTSVATVSNGTVTAVAAGSTTITVTTVDGGKTATCTVTVQGQPTPPGPGPSPDPPVPPIPPVPPVPDPEPPVPPIPPSPDPFVPVEPTEEVKEKIDEANEEMKEIGVEIEFGANPEEIEVSALEEIDAEIITTLTNMEITVEEKTEGEAMAACYDSLGKSSANFSVSLGGEMSSVKADEKVQLLPIFYTVTFTKDELTRNVPKGRTLDVNRLLSKPDPDDDALTELFDCYVIQKQITEGKRKGNLARLIGGGKLQLITAVEARRKKVLRVNVVEGVSIKIGFQYFVADGEQDPKYHVRANMFVIGDGLKNGKITDPLWMNARKAGVEPPDGGSGCNAGIVALAVLFAVPLIFRKKK